MRLIGMMDSPYVRRVAVSLSLMDLPFEHASISVFRQYGEFEAVNPVVKAPSLVTDEAIVLMDSTLILQHLKRLAPDGRTLQPAAPADHARSQRIVGLALAACEKSVQLVYEHALRPPEKRHEPWIDRVRGQVLAAYGLLETEVGGAGGWLFGDRPGQADVTAAVAWSFSRMMIPEIVDDAPHPGLAAFAARAEELPAFRANPMA